MGQEKRLEQVLASRMSPDEQEIRDRLSISNIDPNSTIPPIAPQFRKEPEVWSTNPDLLKQIGHILKIAPEIRGRINRIEQGLTPDVVRAITRRNSPYNKELLDGWDQLNLLGLQNAKTENIWVRPGLDLSEQARVVGHEVAHATGYDEQAPSLKRVEDLMRKLYEQPEELLKSRLLTKRPIKKKK